MLTVKNSHRKLFLSMLGLYLLLASSAPSVMATEENNFNVEQLFKKLLKTETTVIQFAEIKTLSFLDTQLTQKGELEFRPPDYLRRELNHPVSEKTIVDGNEVTLTTSGGVRTMNLSDQPVIAALISAIRAPMTGNVEEVRKWFTIRLQGNENEWTVELVPSKAPLNAQLSSMILRGEDDQLRSIETLEKNQDSSLMILNQ